MIYLKNIMDAQPLFIPKDDERMSEELMIELVSTTDGEEYSFSVVDLHTSDLYYNLAVALPEGIPSGEYKYRLLDDEVQVSSGLLFIGDFANPYQHETTITYKQYESD